MKERVRFYLVANYGLLDSCEVLEGRQQDVTPLGTANILDKAAKLFAQGNKDLIFIFHRLCIVSRLGCAIVYIEWW